MKTLFVALTLAFVGNAFANDIGLNCYEEKSLDRGPMRWTKVSAGLEVNNYGGRFVYQGALYTLKKVSTRTFNPTTTFFKAVHSPDGDVTVSFPASLWKQKCSVRTGKGCDVKIKFTQERFVKELKCIIQK